MKDLFRIEVEVEVGKETMRMRNLKDYSGTV